MDLPGPRPIPILGNLHQLKRAKMDFFSGCRRDYGDIVPFRFGSAWPGILLSDPDDIGVVLLDKGRVFSKSRFFWRQVDAVFGRGLIVNDGDSWVRQRRIAAPAFVPRRVAGYLPPVFAATRKTLSRWRNGDIVDVHACMTELALRIIVETLFGTCPVDEVTAFERAVHALNAAVAGRFSRPFLIDDRIPIPSNVRYRRALAVIDDFVIRRVSERRASPGDRGDFLSTLLDAIDEEGRPLTDRTIRDEVVTMLLAGHETTALVLSWAADFLSRNPHEDESVAAVVAAAGSAPDDLEGVTRLTAVDDVVSETMRLRPPGWIFSRQATEDCVLGGMRVPAGTGIYVCPWLLHRDPRFWTDPDTFRPARWTREMRESLPRFAYLPYGGGQRVCVGRAFAAVEIVAVLATILSEWRFSTIGEPERDLVPSVTLQPAGGIRVRVERRA